MNSSLLVGLDLTPEASSLVECCTRQVQPKAMPSRSGHNGHGKTKPKQNRRAFCACRQLTTRASPAHPPGRFNALQGLTRMDKLAFCRSPRVSGHRATSMVMPEAEETSREWQYKHAGFALVRSKGVNWAPIGVVEISPFGTPDRPARPRGMLVNLTLGRRPCGLGGLTTIPTGFG